MDALHNFQDIHYYALGDAAHPTTIIWAHGWGQSHASFIPLATSLQKFARHIVLDLPGFGASPLQGNGEWGSREYADFIAKFIEDHLGGRPVIWVGHSFGCRVGAQLAAAHPDLISRMVFIGGAGLPRKRSPYFKARVMLFKALKNLPFINKDKLRQKFGSRDYLDAGALRGTFLSVIREDLSPQARKVKCPTLLIYGAQDTETPPEIGRRYQALMKNATMVELADQDHYTVLGSGKNLVAPLIKKFIAEAP